MPRGSRDRLVMLVAVSALLAASGCAEDPTTAAGGTGSETIKVGVLHSLSGTMAISEVTVRDAELLAMEEINAAGGLLGKKLEPVVEDGASDWPTFAEKAQKLISQDKAATVFGGWTSASRKAMLPVFERNKAWTTCGSRARRRSSWSAATTSSRVPRTRSSKRTRRPTA